MKYDYKLMQITRRGLLDKYNNLFLSDLNDSLEKSSTHMKAICFELTFILGSKSAFFTTK